MGRYITVCREDAVDYQSPDSGVRHLRGVSETTARRRERCSDDSESDQQIESPVQKSLPIGYIDPPQPKEKPEPEGYGVESFNQQCERFFGFRRSEEHTSELQSRQYL